MDAEQYLIVRDDRLVDVAEHEHVRTPVTFVEDRFHRVPLSPITV